VRSNSDDNRTHVNANDNPSNQNHCLGIVFFRNFIKMKQGFYEQIYSKKNLVLAWRNARKGKTQKHYVLEFEKNLIQNINSLHHELKNQTYQPKPMQVFILRDPKTRKISKSDFRDRIVHHTICNIIELVFDKTFIYDNCANRKNKGSLFALRRFDEFSRKVSKNNSRKCFILKADIKHYFQEINHEILLGIIKRRINDEKVLSLMQKIFQNTTAERDGFFDNKGMPLGNLTSQFFANVYLNELDQFVKHILKIKYYIRYVDDFVIFDKSKKQLKMWKIKIEEFLEEKLKLNLHPDKSRIILFDRGVDFVGFRNFYYFMLLRSRNIKNIERKIKLFKESKISKEKFSEIWQGWNAYANWANSFNLKKRMLKQNKLF